eukprot:COSAG06_NODE_25512_length_635_cov_0.697761_1_plen_112_part_01
MLLPRRGEQCGRCTERSCALAVASADAFFLVQPQFSTVWKMDAPTGVKNRTTPKRQAPPLRRIGTLPARIGTVPGQRSRVGVAAPGQRRPGALQQLRDSPAAVGTRVGSAAP